MEELQVNLEFNYVWLCLVFIGSFRAPCCDSHRWSAHPPVALRVLTPGCWKIIDAWHFGQSPEMFVSIILNPYQEWKTTYHLLQDFFSHHKHPLGLHGRLWKLETSAQFQLSTWLLFRMLWMDAVATWSVQLLGGRFGMQFKSHWKGDHEMMGSLLRRSSATGA